MKRTPSTAPHTPGIVMQSAARRPAGIIAAVTAFAEIGVASTIRVTYGDTRRM